MEKLTLRKANAIQAEIKKAIAVPMTDTFSITEYTADYTTKMVAGTQEFNTTLDRKIALNAALYNIRKSVAQANASSGISDILTDIQFIDAKMAVYSAVATKQPVKSFDEIDARISKIKNAPTESRIYGHRDTVETSIVDGATIEVAKVMVKELKRHKQDLQDKLLTLNVNTTITVSIIDMATLMEEGIL
jgi:putative ubiquitin-RnfH superfamily antitoxin RatB of RatAB toxin-antitoxin module